MPHPLTQHFPVTRQFPLTGQHFLAIQCPLIVVIVLALSYFLGSPAQAEPTAADYGTILNLSGRQRMLSQKMTKEALLIALSVDVHHNAKHLAKTAALFDTTLKGLKDGSAELALPPTTNPVTRQQLAVIESIWQTFNRPIQQVVNAQSVSDDQLAQLATQNLPLLAAMNKAVGLYEKEAQQKGLKTDPGLATTLNLAGRQRMLSQKMSKEFLLVALEYKIDETKFNLQNTMALFDQTLNGLIEGDAELRLPATRQKPILAQLDAVDNLWQAFRPAIENGADFGTDKIAAADIQTIASQNLPLLKAMNAAVQLYAKETGQ